MKRTQNKVLRDMGFGSSYLGGLGQMTDFSALSDGPDQWFSTRGGSVLTGALGNVEGEHFKLSWCMGAPMVEDPGY